MAAGLFMLPAAEAASVLRISEFDSKSHVVGVPLEVVVGAYKSSGFVDNAERDVTLTFKDASSKTIKTAVVKLNSGAFTLTFRHTVVGQVSITASGADITASAAESMLYVSDVPHEVLSTTSVPTSGAQKDTLVAGQAGTLTLVVQDQYGNRADKSVHLVNVKFIGTKSGIISDTDYTVSKTLSPAFTLTVAEGVTVKVTSSVATAYALPPDLTFTIVPDAVHHFLVQMLVGTAVIDNTATVDKAVVAAVTAEDKYKNQFALTSTVTVQLVETEVVGMTLVERGTSKATVSLEKGYGTAAVTLQSASLYGASVVAQNGLGSNTVHFTLLAGATVSFVIVNPTDGDPSDPSKPGSTDNEATVQIEAQDQYSNVAKTETNTVSLLVSGSAKIASGSDIVNINAGVGTMTLTNTVAETVTLKLADTAKTGYSVTSVQDIIFVWGEPVQIFMTDPGSAIPRSNLPIKVEIRDKNRNVVESATMKVSLLGDKATEPASQTVEIVLGRATVYVLNKNVEVVQLSMKDDFSTGLDVTSSRRTVSFEPGAKPPFLDMALDTLSTTTGLPIKVVVTVRDGVNPSIVQQQIMTGEKATLIAYEHATGKESKEEFAVTNGVGTITFVTEQAGKVDIRVEAPKVTGVNMTSTDTVFYAADVPAIFLLQRTQDSQSVNSNIAVSILTQDQFGNPTDKGTLGVNLVATGTVSGRKILRPGTNPVPLSFGNGGSTTVLVTTTVAEEVIITMETPSPASIAFTDSITLDFVPEKLHRVYFQATKNGTVDAAHLVNLIAGDVFHNRIESANISVSVKITDTASSDEVLATKIVNGHATVSFNRKLPCDVVVHVAQGTNGVAGLDYTSQAKLAISPGQSVRYTLIDPKDGDPNDPNAPGSTDTSVVVSVEARDQFDNVATSEEKDVRIVASGSAQFESGSGVADIRAGKGSVTITDTVAEEVALSLVDSSATKYNVKSTQKVRIYWELPPACRSRRLPTSAQLLTASWKSG